MMSVNDMLARLRAAASPGFDEWRVQDPTDGSYCVAYSRLDTMDPERDARAWLADHKQRFPRGRYVDYVVACVRVVPKKDLLLAEAADEIDRMATEAAALRRERDELREQVSFVGQHLGIISGVLGSAEPIEIDDIAARLHLLIAERDELRTQVHIITSERDELAARLAEIEQAEPVQGPTWLTDEQIAQITAQTWGSVDIAPQSAAAFARAIEAWMLHAHQGTAAEPERAEPAANELPTRCTECGQLGWHKFGCSHVAHERGLRVMAQSGDSTSCPRVAR